MLLQRLCSKYYSLFFVRVGHLLNTRSLKSNNKNTFIQLKTKATRGHAGRVFFSCKRLQVDRAHCTIDIQWSLTSLYLLLLFLLFFFLSYERSVGSAGGMSLSFSLFFGEVWSGCRRTQTGSDSWSVARLSGSCILQLRVSGDRAHVSAATCKGRRIIRKRASLPHATARNPRPSLFTLAPLHGGHRVIGNGSHSLSPLPFLSPIFSHSGLTRPSYLPLTISSDFVISPVLMKKKP